MMPPFFQKNEIETNTHNRFPIFFQLGILSGILVLMFGFLLFEQKSELAKPEPQPSLVQYEEATLVPAVPQKLGEIPIVAQAAYVWDIRSQRALYTKNAEVALPLASVTKLMTSLVAYELIADDTSTDITASAVGQEGNSGLFIGEEFTAEKLRELALVSSSNDAAYALAANVGLLLGSADPAAQFVAAMNIRAEELGLHTLQFWNPTGLDLSPTEPGAVGSAKEVSFLMEYIILQYPHIVAPTQEVEAIVYNNAGAYHEISNTNEALTAIPNLLGSKTGYTDLAGGNLTVVFDAGFNRPVVVTVLGSTYEQRFSDVLALVTAVQDSLGNEIE